MGDFHYIFGLCFLLTGTITGFLLQRPDNTHTSEEWSDWKVLQEYPICFLTRTRACLSGGCTETMEFKYCKEVASWGEWGPWQCSVKANRCYFGRTRNCSVTALSDCYSNGSNHVVTVWEDFKSCPCAEGTTIVSGQGNGHWEEWSNWYCTTYSGNCYIYRTRLCSIQSSPDCPTSGGSQIKTWNCPCQNDSNSVKNNTNFSTIKSASWLEWGSWECHRVNTQCLLLRRRLCSSNETECTGKSYAVDTCKTDTCDGLTTGFGVSGSNLLSTVMSYITAVTSAVFTSSVSASPTSVGLVSSTPPSSNSTSIGLTSRLGIASSSRPPASATTALTTLQSVMVSSVAPCIQSVCTVWEDWGYWRCRLGNNGTCTMSRSRECSTGTPGECWKDALMTRPCDPSVCPDKVKLEQSGQCRDYVSDRRCVDDSSTCNIISDSFHPICQDKHVSHDICPKACGCCEELPYWLEWSSWKCQLETNHSCEMHRTRNCSTGSLDDCVGKSAETTSCSNTVCPDVLIVSTRVDCSLFDHQATKCIDHKGCLEFKSDFEAVCLEPKAAVECPVTCGCCKLPYWLEWSSWKCHLALNHTCEMQRTRNCSTGSLDDCVGKSAETTSCSNTVCPDNLSTKVDCSAVDTKCVDGPGCSGFKNELLLDLLCSNPTMVAECPITCGCCGLPNWLQWSVWECHMTKNRTCEMRRYRNCSTSSLDDCVGMSTMTTNCPDTVCPVNGEWAEWQEWSKCSHSCSGGTQTRVRTCTNPAPSHGGNDCVGDKAETDSCNYAKCPEWSQWFYGACSVTCGNGTTMRLRHCSSGKDLDCGTGNAFESTTCSEIPCI